MTWGTAGRKPKIALVVAIAAVAVCGLVSQASAVTYTLVDGTSSLVVDTDGSGVYQWTLDGVDQMFQQWFWYRVGDTGPEMSLETLGFVASNSGVTDTDFDGDVDTVSLLFRDAVLEVRVRYSLSGDELGLTSDIAETIDIKNVSGSSLNLSFFQYTDLDLADTPSDDFARIVPGTFTAVKQWDPTGLMGSEQVMAPTPSHYELAPHSGIWNKLTDADADDLSDSVNLMGPGDVTWAFQWDKTLSAGQMLQISKDKMLTVVPEPATMIGVFMGVTGLAGYIRRRRMA